MDAKENDTLEKNSGISNDAIVSEISAGQTHLSDEAKKVLFKRFNKNTRTIDISGYELVTIPDMDLFNRMIKKSMDPEDGKQIFPQLATLLLSLPNGFREDLLKNIIGKFIKSCRIKPGFVYVGKAFNDVIELCFNSYEDNKAVHNVQSVSINSTPYKIRLKYPTTIVLDSCLARLVNGKFDVHGCLFFILCTTPRFLFRFWLF